MRRAMRKYLCLLLAVSMMLLPVGAAAETQEEPAVIQEEGAIPSVTENQEESPAAEITETDVPEEQEPESEEEPEEEVPAAEEPAAEEEGEELPPSEIVEDGIHVIEGKYYYFLNDEAQTGLQTVDGAVYLFGGDGAAVIGPAYVGQDLYFFDAEGKAYTGGALSYEMDGKTVVSFFGEDGKAFREGYCAVAGVASGDALGVITPAGETGKSYYYFQASGVAFTGGALTFKHSNDKTYTYYFQSSGQAFTGGYKNTGTKYEASYPECKPVSKADGKNRYYYFKSNGQAFTKGTLTFKHSNDKTYTFFFQSSGEAYTQGYKNTTTAYEASYPSCDPVSKGDGSGHQYYFQSNGHAFTKGALYFKHTNGKYYTMYFQSNGRAREKVGYLHTTNFYTSTTGSIAKSKGAGDYYFWLQTNHFAYTGGFLRFDHTNGKTYSFYFQKDGTAIRDLDKGFYKRCKATVAGKITDISDDNGYAFYFKPNGQGVALTGWHQISGAWGWYGSGGIREFKSNTMHEGWSRIKGRTSPTKYYIVVDCTNCEVYTFTGAANNWKPKFLWKCSPGKPSTPTVKGTYSIQGRGYYFNTTDLTCYYYTQFYGNYLFHSVPYYKNTWKLKYPTLGKQLSHGCVRLATENAKWFYDNMPSRTKVYIYG